MVKNPPAMQETGFDSWVRKIPWRRKWQIISVFLPQKSHGQRSLADYSRWGHKESDMSDQPSTYTHTHTHTHTHTSIISVFVF